VAYLEAWHVIDMANEVFGFGNWDAGTVEMKREHDPVHIPSSEEHQSQQRLVLLDLK
jgi:recombination DNA repair RAD52 pathway protein